MLTPITKIDLPSYIYSFHPFLFQHIIPSTHPHTKSNPGALVPVIITYMKKEPIFHLRGRLSPRDSVKAQKKEQTAFNNLYEKGSIFNLRGRLSPRDSILIPFFIFTFLVCSV